MADKEYAHLILCLDRSGSMGGSKLEGGIEGVNQLLVDQAKAEQGYCTVTMVQFDTDIEELYSFKPVHMVEHRTKENWLPRGGTALLDAIGQAITTDMEKIGQLEENKRPGVVILSVVTDGHENRSTEYTREQIKKLIEEREADNWVVSYIGAGVDAFGEAAGLGVKVSNTANAGGDKAGVLRGYAGMGNVVSRSRRATSAGQLSAAKESGDLGFTEEEIADMGSKPPS